MQNVITNKWSELKSEAMKAWSEISQAEIEGTNGNLQDLISLVQKKLGVAREEAATKLMELAAIVEGDQSQVASHDQAEEKNQPTKH